MNSPDADAPSPSPVPSAPSESTVGFCPTEKSPASPSRVYSPSETETWLTCPVYRQFRRNWRPIAVEWNPARLLGVAVQAGLSHYLRGGGGRGEHLRPGDEAAVEEAVVRTLTEGFEDQATYTLEGLVKLALRGVQTALDVDLFARHTVLMVDEPLGHSRPDVVSRHETEGLGVTDFKVSRDVPERYRVARLSSYETDDQFWHYAWEVGETLGEPVKWVRPVLIILAPKATVLQTSVRVTPERLAFWLSGAEQHWRDMQGEDEGTRPAVPRWLSCQSGKYGPCEAYDFCHRLDRDPARCTTYYERVR